MLLRLQAVLRTFTVYSQRNHYDERLLKALCCRVRLLPVLQRHQREDAITFGDIAFLHTGKLLITESAWPWESLF